MAISPRGLDALEGRARAAKGAVKVSLAEPLNIIDFATNPVNRPGFGGGSVGWISGSGVLPAG